jgi:pSer/pThr/pTyr-binding forkhead associated (FHA) protein
MWILTAGTGAETTTFRLLPGASKTMGRAHEADLVVDAPLVSRVHCRLEAGKGALEVVDLASTNGTYVNDRRIERARLMTGDRLRVGRIELAVSRGDH